MKLLSIEEVTFNWNDLNIYDHPLPTTERSGGEHVSNLIKRVALKNGLLTPDDELDEMPLRVMIGTGVEWAVARMYDMWWQPGEYELDGVIGSPDGLSSNPDVPWDVDEHGNKLWNCLEEFKCTAKSCRLKDSKDPSSHRDILRDWMWVSQLKSYLCLLSTHYKTPFRHARLHVVYLRGNYMYPLTERYFRYLIEFTESEIRQNWLYLNGERQ